MKIYDMEFKDELKVTKAEAKQISLDFNHEIIKNKCALKIYNNSFDFVTKTYILPSSKNWVYKNCKWVLTNKLKQGDIVKEVFQEDKNLYVYDKKDKDYNMKWCWCIYKNRPKTALCDDWVYKLVERE